MFQWVAPTIWAILRRLSELFQLVGFGALLFFISLMLYRGMDRIIEKEIYHEDQD